MYRCCKRRMVNDDEIYFDMADREATYLPPPRYCLELDHKVWYQEDYESPLLASRRCLLCWGSTSYCQSLSPQTTEIMHILRFFEDVGTVVSSVRLIVNPEGKHVGFGFVEFASAHSTIIRFCWWEDLIRSKTLFVDNLSSQTDIPHIINFFKGVGEVVHVRLFVDLWSHLPFGLRLYRVCFRY